MIKQVFFTLTLCISFTTAFGAAAPDFFTLRDAQSWEKYTVNWRTRRARTPYFQPRTVEEKTEIERHQPEGFTLEFLGRLGRWGYRGYSKDHHYTDGLLCIYQSAENPEELSINGVRTCARKNPATNDTFIHLEHLDSDGWRRHGMLYLESSRMYVILGKNSSLCRDAKETAEQACPDHITFDQRDKKELEQTINPSRPRPIVFP